MIRLFVAVELPDDVRQRIAALRGGIPGARWLDPGNMHITLRFIGEVDEGMSRDIDAALSMIRAPAFEAALEGVGYFGAARAARVLYVPVARNGPLSHLHGKVESALVRIGLEPEGRKYQPHVTLARLRGAHARRLIDFVAENNLFRAGPFQVTSFALFSSFLSESGSIHRAEAVYPLASV
ncbi:MAG: RNA 2',3'-cyclic phosphodiesterase [Alphaproteobacteria bacterium]